VGARQKLSAEQFANSGPSPTQEDAFTTVAHLADSVAFNHKHGSRHLVRVMDALDQMPIEARLKKPLYWNLEHATKHSLEAANDAQKLAKHVRNHPAFRGEVSALRNHEARQRGGI